MNYTLFTDSPVVATYNLVKTAGVDLLFTIPDYNDLVFPTNIYITTMALMPNYPTPGIDNNLTIAYSKDSVRHLPRSRMVELPTFVAEPVDFFLFI